MLDGSMDIVQRADHALYPWPAAAADGRRAFRRAAPAAFEFIKRCVELAPLTAREEAPFQRVLQTVVIRAGLAAGDLRAGALDVQPLQDRMLPGPVVGALADETIKPPPVLRRDRLVPFIQFRKNDAHGPG